MYGLNIPDMSKIVYSFGLIPIPIDVDYGTTAPIYDSFIKLVNPKVKAIMLTYIYGIMYPIDQIVSICKEKNIEIVEDAAETFLGRKYCGNPHAAITMMSFGLIKRCTSFIGCVTFIRDQSLYEAMNKINESYPIYPEKLFLKKALNTFLPLVALNNSTINFGAMTIARWLKVDVKELVVSQLRGFKNEKEFLQKFCFKPCAANLDFLSYRLSNFSQDDYVKNIAKLQHAVNVLEAHSIYCPGYKIKDRGFW